MGLFSITFIRKINFSMLLTFAIVHHKKTANTSEERIIDGV